jgi:hypothetical protein
MERSLFGTGLVCKNPARELLTAARCLRRSESDPSIVGEVASPRERRGGA